MKKKFVILLLITTINLIGCSNQREAINTVESIDKPISKDVVEMTEVQVSDENNIIEEVVVETEVTKSDVELILEKFIEVINKNDPNGFYDIKEYLQPSIRDNIEFYSDYFPTILKDYEAIFHSEDVVLYELVGISNGSNAIYEFKLTSESGFTYPIRIYKAEEDIYHIIDIVINYVDDKERKVKNFIEAIRDNDSEALAFSLASCEGSEMTYPVAYAEEVLDKYKEVFDLESINWKFTGFIEDFIKYRMIVFGTKNGEVVTHEFILITGDGLVGIIDEWVPKFDCN